MSVKKIKEHYALQAQSAVQVKTKRKHLETSPFVLGLKEKNKMESSSSVLASKGKNIGDPSKQHVMFKPQYSRAILESMSSGRKVVVVNK